MSRPADASALRGASLFAACFRRPPADAILRHAHVTSPAHALAASLGAARRVALLVYRAKQQASHDGGTDGGASNCHAEHERPVDDLSRPRVAEGIDRHRSSRGFVRRSFHAH